MKSLLTSILFFLSLQVFSQGNTEPEWVKLMHQPGVDVGNIRMAYEKYYKSHPFEKNNETQEYKRLLMKHTRDNNGSAFQLPPNEQKFSEQEYIQRSALGQHAESTTSQWECLGPIDFDKDAASKSYACGAAHVYTVEQSQSNPTILYAGSANAGVWRSNDKGLHWFPLMNSMMLGEVRAIEIDYTNPDIVYAGGNGKLYKSIDGGLNWTATGSLSFQSLAIDVNDIVMSPIDHLQLWTATEYGFYRTVDGGNNWIQISSGIFQEVEFKPGDPSIMYTIKVPGINTEFYKSTDFGVSFSIRHGGYPNAATPDEQKRTEIAVTPAAPSIIYAFATGKANSGSGLYGIYVSHDEGENWNFQCCGSGPGGIPDSVTNKNLCAWSDHGEDDGGQYYYDLALEVSPFDSLEVHACAVNHWVSYDGGINFTCPSKWSHSDKVNYVHADIHDCHFYGNDWWWACDGGIFYSHTGGDTITRRQTGIEGTDFWGFGMGEQDGDEVMVGGTYHNGTLLKDDTTYTNGWLSTMGGDNTLGSVNYGYPRIIFSDYGKHHLSGDRTVALTQMTCAMLPSSSFWVGEGADQEYSPFAYNTVYIAKDSTIWKSTDNGASYSLLHDFAISGKVTAIEVSWQHPNVMYAAFYPDWFANKKLFKSVDGGLNWSDITPANFYFNNANLWAPYDIAISTEDDQKLWLVRTMQSSTYNNLDGYKVFVTTDGGGTWNNLTTATLNGEYITNVEYQRGSDAVYIGTRRGVYYRKSSMPDWALFNNNLPLSTSSTKLLIDYKKSRIVNATNRSVWECDLYEMPPTKAFLSVDNTSIFCTRDTVYYHDHSVITDSNATWLWSFPGGNPSSSTLQNPKVTYPASGTYSVTLAISDAYGSDSQTRTNFVTVSNGCAPDTIPGNCLTVDGSGDYASVPPLNLNSNTITLSAWIKPQGTQNDWGGILFTRSGLSTSGLSIKSDNEVRFHWNGDRWWIATGLYAPDNEWTHIALVVTPDSSTVFVNGIGSTDVNPCAADEFDGNLNIGFDSYGGTRYFKGQIDEVSVYNRSLSQNEIRELMHLTRNPLADPSLLHYYQFNENAGQITDRSGINHAVLINGAARVPSDGPFGGGSSFRTNITSSGATTFTNTGFKITYPAAATVPNGEVVVSRINLSPDQLPAPLSASRSYWIADNYGINQNTSQPSGLQFTGVGNVSLVEGSNPQLFKLYTRNHNDWGSTWIGAIDSADVALAGTDGTITYQSPVSLTSLGQFVLLKSGTPTDIKKVKGKENYADAVAVYPNPSKPESSIMLKSSMDEQLLVHIYDESGKEILTKTFFHSVEISTSGLSRGSYLYSVQGGGRMQNGIFMVE